MSETPEINITNIEQAMALFENAANTMMRIAGLVGEMADKMSGSATEKSTKKIGGMFKSMAKASPQAFILEKLMMLLEPFINLLDMFSPIIEILAAIIELALLPIMQELMPLIMMVVNFLWQYKDVIQAVVRIVITAIKWFFTMNFIWKAVVKAVIIVVDWITIFVNIIMMLVKWVMVIVNAFLGFIAVLKALGDKILGFFRMIKDLIDNLLGGGFDIPGFAEGGLVTRPTIAMLGEKEPELITPLSKLGSLGTEERLDDMIYAMEENTEVQQEILLLKERKARWER